MDDADGLPADLLLAALLGAMDSAAIGCTVVVDRDGVLRRVYANAAAAKLFGLTLDELQLTPPLLPSASSYGRAARGSRWSSATTAQESPTR